MNLIEKMNTQLANDGFQFAPVSSPTQQTSFKQKVLAAIDKQLQHLSEKSDPNDLNYQSKGNSGKYWWSCKPVDSQRVVRYYVANRLLFKTTDALHVPNTVDSVRNAISAFRAIAEAKSESEWEQFSEEREQQREGTKAKKQ